MTQTSCIFMDFPSTWQAWVARFRFLRHSSIMRLIWFKSKLTFQAHCHTIFIKLFAALVDIKTELHLCNAACRITYYLNRYYRLSTTTTALVSFTL